MNAPLSFAWRHGMAGMGEVARSATYGRCAMNAHPTRLHVNYAESMLHIPGGLPRFRDMPAEMGGRGKCWRSEAPAED